MNIGFYAGSFDPFTYGHLKVVKKASIFFDKIVVGIGVNPCKQRRFDKIEMKKAIQKVLIDENIDNAEVIVYDGLTTDAAQEIGANYLIRGLRGVTDYNEEEATASINEEISKLDTMYIRAGELGNVSSSMVIELYRNNKDVSRYLPKAILEFVNQRN